MLMQKIEQDVIAAMKEKKQDILTVLRSLRAVIKNHMIDNQSRDVQLDDSSVIKLIRSELKKRNDAIELYRQGGRNDLVDKELFECDILNRYLPKSISDEELLMVIESVASGIGHFITNKDMEVVISGVLALVGDRTDGGKISSLVKKYIQDKTIT